MLLRFGKSGLILMYHRINENTTDYWSLNVSKSNFEEHLRVLKTSFAPLSLSEFNAQRKQGRLPANSVCLTFDDGYYDNFSTAAPLLYKYQIPATFFITTELIGSDSNFWWDELEYLIAASEHIPDFLYINGRDHNEGIDVEKLIGSSADSQISLHKNTDRLKQILYRRIWNNLLYQGAAERKICIEAIKNQLLSVGSSRCPYRMMSCNNIIELGKDSQIEIGAHTATHPLLSSQAKSIQSRDILSGIDFLTNLINKNVESFSYPFGSYNNSTLEILKTIKIVRACTTNTMLCSRYDNSLKLPRVHVKDGNSEYFEKLLHSYT